MADDILKNIPLPADLPENWTSQQTVAPTGAEVGMEEQYGYNYLMRQGNNAQKAATALNGGKLSLSGGHMTGPLIMPGGGFVLGVGTNAGARNCAFRGNALGSSVTNEQWAAIQNGTFDGLFLGDYWIINGVNWRIAGFNYWLNCGDTPFTKNHLAIVPDTNLYNHKMNEKDTTEGGYANSLMRKSGLEKAKATIKATFGANHVLSHREYLTNAVTNGKPSGGAWFDSDVELMNQPMVYGSYIYTPCSDVGTVPKLRTIGKCQLPLFQCCPWMITNRNWYWLRDVVSSSYFAGVSDQGDADSTNALYKWDVRPVFPIG